MTDQVEVVRYKSTAEFQRDATKRISAGWRVAGQSQESGQSHRVRGAAKGGFLGGFFLGLPIAGAAAGALGSKRSEGPITVAWTRAPDAVAAADAEQGVAGEVGGTDAQRGRPWWQGSVRSPIGPAARKQRRQRRSED